MLRKEQANEQAGKRKDWSAPRRSPWGTETRGDGAVPLSLRSALLQVPPRGRACAHAPTRVHAEPVSLQISVLEGSHQDGHGGVDMRGAGGGRGREGCRWGVWECAYGGTRAERASS